jgi:hypothetical protein
MSTSSLQNGLIVENSFKLTEAMMRALRTFERCAFVFTGSVWTCSFFYINKARADTNLAVASIESMDKLDSYAQQQIRFRNQMHDAGNLVNSKV